MSEKDYEAIAAIIKNLSVAELQFVDELVGTLADYFAEENPRFDRERFLEACGL